MANNYFDWVDYLVFGVMLLCSALIGVYFAFFAKQKQNTTSEYLLGGKKMGIFPISMSLIASYISGISLLGIPAEVYVYGTQFWLLTWSQVLVCITMSLVYLPVFYKLQITSSYEYLNLRFNKSVRLLGSIFFIIKMLLYIPVVVYVPALAFNQVTGVNLHLITPIVCFVCIFYTTLGGLKAVVWTDTLQTILMFGGVIIVMLLGIIKVGGIGEVIARSSDSDRLEIFNMDIDPRSRHTFWTVFVGSYFNFLAGCTVNQAMVQRCLAMPSLRKANITVNILSVGVLLNVSMCVATGLIIYAYFYQCDPISTKMIGKADQVLPYFVMEISQSIPGLPGLFVASVFSAALSSMSTGLNSMTGVIFEDMIRPMVKKPMTEAKASTLMKFMAAILGLICVALVFLVEKLGALVIQAVSSLTSIVSGPLLGLFTLGMCFPWANSKGALVGGLTSFVSVAGMSFGSQYHIAQGLITFPKKAISIDGCPSDIFNNTIVHLYKPTDDSVFWVFRISYLWYTTIGMLVTVIVGLAVSFMTGPRDVADVHRDLLTPVIHWFLPKTPDHASEEVVKLNQMNLKKNSH